MADLDHTVAGLRCRDVLALLADYVDGELTRGTRARVEEHLRGCDTCERFGGEYADLVASLRRRLPAGETRGEGEDRLKDRLKARMARVWHEEDP